MFYTIYIVAVAVVLSMVVFKEDDEHKGAIKHLEWAAPVVFALSLTHFSYYSIRVYDVWHFSLKKFRALWKRNSTKGKEFMKRRLEMQKAIRGFVGKQLSESTFGGVYGEKGIMDKPKSKNRIHPEPLVEESNEGSEGWSESTASGGGKVR